MDVAEAQPLQLRVVIDDAMGVGAKVGEHLAEHRDDWVAQDARNPAKTAGRGTLAASWVQALSCWHNASWQSQVAASVLLLAWIFMKKIEQPTMQ
jgi:hypothetical protein